MNARQVPLFCLAYILGLLVAAGNEQYGLTIIIFLGIAGGILFKIAPQYRWWGLRWQTGLGIFLIFLVALISFYFRFPTPTNNDVSQIIPADKNGIAVTVTGKVLNSPTLNRSGKLRFWLAVQNVNNPTENTPVTGKLYTTVPTDFKEGLNSGSIIEVRGYLYQPSTPNNPGQFDFRNYLQKNGAFAGISGRELTILEENNSGLWRLRERIVNVHVKALGTPQGELISSMVLGRKVVNLPFALQDQFLKAGLAHILAASGFHVSLLLGVVLGITQRFQVSVRFGIGLIILLLYVGLTGLQPSILRASLMGVAGLLGLLAERKVNSVRLLLIIATILLFINPLWIIDLGFQFSFLATLGLIVTLPPLLKQWEFLPPTLTSLIAVPIAVYPWVFPLQLFHFGTVATYSIPLNILATPLAVFLILGGMISGFFGLIVSQLGSTIALLLSYPTQWLIDLVSSFNQLPGSYLLFGKVTLWQLLAVYGLIIFIWQSSQGQKYWKLALLGAIALIIVPVTYKQLTFRQITVFVTKQPAVILIQNQGQVSLINCGDEDTVRYTLFPFLQQEGIQAINHAIALSSQNQWENFQQRIPIKQLFYSPTVADEIQAFPNLKAVQKQPIASNRDLVKEKGLQIKQMTPLLLTIGLEQQQWGILTNPTQIVPNLALNLPKIDVLLWKGEDVSRSWLEQLNPESAIAVSNHISEESQQTIQQQNLNFYWTGKHGAVQWTPQQGLSPMLN